MRLQERRFDAYAEYLSDVRQLVAVANRIAASLISITEPRCRRYHKRRGFRSWPNSQPRRTASSERARLLVGEETITALRDLNDAAWVLN